MGYGVNKWQPSNSGIRKRATSRKSASRASSRSTSRKRSSARASTKKRATKARTTKARSRSATRTSTRKKSARTSSKLYKVYDLANGGKLYKVTKDDWRYEEEDQALMEGRAPRFVHRKPSAKAKREYAVTEVVGASPAGKVFSTPEAQKIAGAAVVAALPKAAKVGKNVIKTFAKSATGAIAAGAAQVAAQSGVSTAAATAGLVGVLAAAGIGSYFSARYIISNFLSRGARLDAALKALKKGQRDLAAKLGRPLSSAENKALYEHYKAVVDEINRSKVAAFLDD